MSNPWERQQYESQQSFEAFQIYRDLGEERSITKVAQKCNKNRSLIARWSTQHNWVERAAAYDQYMDQQALKAEERERKKMAKRHAEIAMKFQEKIKKRLKTLDPEELSTYDLMKWLEISVKVERLARGESTENQQQSGGVIVEIVNDLHTLED